MIVGVVLCGARDEIRRPEGARTAAYLVDALTLALVGFLVSEEHTHRGVSQTVFAVLNPEV